MSQNNRSDRKPLNISRREFISTGALAATAFTIVPRFVLGGSGYQAPSDKLNIACVGVGGMGRNDVKGVSTENIVALCDADWTRAAETFADFPKAKKYSDFRVMLEKEKDIDAITVTTPDHNHAVIAMAAMKMGIHAYVQKPLTATIYEARKLAEAAKKYKLVTQMGNQGHASEGARLINEWIWDGAIGDVTEVHTWTNRPIWPQGIGRPEELPAIPPTLNWDVWQGPAAEQPYHPAYLPFTWRGWLDYGTGAVGDMGAHIIDHPFWALKLGSPKSVQASSTKLNDETYPLATIITYDFPERDNMPPVRLKWFDGRILPPRPEDLEPGRKMGDGGGGVIFYGTKGKLMCSTYGSNPRLIPESRMKTYERPEKSIPRSPGIREEWIDAIKNGKTTTSNFGYASQLTEMMLLGNIAVQMSPKNVVLNWDGPNMRVTNLEEANNLVHREYRKGWSL
jgi:predicted dehydrogenase